MWLFPRPNADEYYEDPTPWDVFDLVQKGELRTTWPAALGGLIVFVALHLRRPLPRRAFWLTLAGGAVLLVWRLLLSPWVDASRYTLDYRSAWGLPWLAVPGLGLRVGEIAEPAAATLGFGLLIAAVWVGRGYDPPLDSAQAPREA
ncbi:MAG: hypothetical protein AAF907_04625 [Planctomycetota bacterium]